MASHIKIVTIVIVALFAVIDLCLIIGQFNLWQSTELTKYLLPDYQPVYFYVYVFSRVIAPDLVAALLSLAVFLAFSWLNKRRGEVVFEKEEPYLAGIMGFLTGYPGWLYYFLLIVGIYLFWHLLNRIMGKKKERLPLYSLWGGVSILVIILVNFYLKGTDSWLLLKI